MATDAMVVVSKTGQSYDAELGLACSAIDVQLGSAHIRLPAVCANYADYSHAHKAGVPLRAPMFNYHHRNTSGYSIAHKATQNNIEAKIAEVQERHRPSMTIMSLEHPGDLTASGLGAFHRLQMRLGLPIITTVEKNPMQDLRSLMRELEPFDRLETDQERFPTISVRCDPIDFKEKLLYIVSSYNGFNLQWGGYSKFSERWGILSSVLRDYPVWCNVVNILNREVSIGTPMGQKIRTSGMVRSLLYGGHSHCFAWPHYHPPAGGGASRRQAQKATLFNPRTWCYEPCDLEYSVARTRSFNAIQEALGLAREQILAGTLYSRHCRQRLGLNEAMAQILQIS